MPMFPVAEVSDTVPAVFAALVCRRACAVAPSASVIAMLPVAPVLTTLSIVAAVFRPIPVAAVALNVPADSSVPAVCVMPPAVAISVAEPAPSEMSFARLMLLPATSDRFSRSPPGVESKILLLITISCAASSVSALVPLPL